MMSQVTGPLVGHRILLVEDEYLIAETMEEWLRRAGAKVIGPVPSVEQAFELIEDKAAALDGAVLEQTARKLGHPPPYEGRRL
jgi:CheY-like chemotaxis protein